MSFKLLNPKPKKQFWLLMTSVLCSKVKGFASTVLTAQTHFTLEKSRHCGIVYCWMLRHFLYVHQKFAATPMSCALIFDFLFFGIIGFSVATHN